MKINEFEKRVAVELLSNSRTPSTQIAKKVGGSRSQVETAIIRLEKNHIIQSYITRISQKQFCAGVASLRITLRKPTKQRIIQAKNILMNAPRVNWVAQLCGSAHLVCTVLYTSAQDLATHAADITKQLGELLAKHELLLYIEELLFERSTLLTRKKHNYGEAVIFDANKRSVLNETDTRILCALFENARTPVSKISVGKLTAEAIRLRIKKLQEQEIITGFTAVLNPRALNLQTYYVRLQLDEGKDAIHEKLRAYAHEHSYIVFAARTTGDFNSVLTLCATDNKEFSEQLNSIRSAFSDALLADEFHLILDEYKEVFVPKELILGAAQ